MVNTIMTNSTYIPELAYRQTPWQANPLQLGVPSVTASEAIHMAGLAYPIIKEPMVIQRTGQVADVMAVGREVNYPTGESEFISFGTVSKDYTVMQATDIAEKLDPITDKYPVVSVGADSEGANIYMFLSAGTQSIAGEEHDLYFIIKDSRNGRRGLSFTFMPLRLACKNGLVYFNREATASATFHHIKSINQDVTSFSQGLLPRMADTMASAIQEFNHMAEVKITDSIVAKIVASAYPAPRLPRSLRWLSSENDSLMMGLTGDVRRTQLENSDAYSKYQKAVDNVQELKDNVANSYDTFNTRYAHKDLDNTAWALWNSIVEVEDHGRRTRGHSMASIVGDRASVKSRSFKTACELIS